MCCRHLTDSASGVLVYSKTTIILRDEFTDGSNRRVLVTTIVIESLWDDVNGVKEIRNTEFTITSKIENCEILDSY